MRILFVSPDVVGERMAGPGIRAWELAHALAGRHDVMLVAPDVDRTSETVTLMPAGVERWVDLLGRHDVVVTQFLTPPLLGALLRRRTRLVIDAYVPMTLEALEMNRKARPRQRQERAKTLVGVQTLALRAADAVVCASEQQRDLWLGALLALGRLTPEVYAESRDLRQLIDVVPFGLPDQPPVRRGRGPREIEGLPPDAVVALWGGGVWDWFDPLTVIEAVARVRRHDPRLHLAFMGLQHPQQTSSHTTMGGRALALLERTGLRGNGAHVRDGWLPYDERTAYLLDADMTVSANQAIAENRYAFRTRVLDSLWAGRPALLSSGDPLAEAGVRQGWALAMDVGDVDGWALALAKLTADPGLRAEMSRAARSASDSYRWSVVAEPLERILGRLQDRAPRLESPGTAGTIAAYLTHGTRSVLLDASVPGALRRLKGRG